MFDYSDLVISNIAPLASCYSLFLKIPLNTVFFLLFFLNQSTVSEMVAAAMHPERYLLYQLLVSFPGIVLLM